MSSGIPEIKSEQASDYKRIIVGGIFGGVAPGGLEATVYSEQREVTKVLETQPLSPNRATIKRVVECELILDPLTMKSISSWLAKKIKEYEKLFGSIPSPEEIQSRQRRGGDTSQPEN